MEKLPSNSVVAELGVAQGDFSDFIMKLNKPKKLYLIDAWGDKRYAAGLEYVRNRFQHELQSGYIVIKQGMSTEILKEFPDNNFDWIYIDTNHSYETTLEELNLCSIKVKTGGYIAGHDFVPGNPRTGYRYGVIPACHEFCVKENWELIYLTVEYGTFFSFCLKKIA